MAVSVEAQLRQCNQPKADPGDVTKDAQSQKMDKGLKGTFQLSRPGTNYKATITKQMYMFQVFNHDWVPLSGNYSFAVVASGKQEIFEIVDGDVCFQTLAQTDTIDGIYVTPFRDWQD